MAELKAKFSLIDEMSDKLSSIADKGQEVMNNWEQTGNSASLAIDTIASSASNAVSTVCGVAKSLDDLIDTANSAEANADNLSEAMNGIGNSIDNAASETDNWTSAVGSYNKEALEMVYTTEELVEMGYKTAEALGDQEEMFALCEQSASQLNSTIENAVNSHEQLSNTIETTNEVMERLTDSGKLSAESQKQLENAGRTAAQAMQELESAQTEARASMDNYDSVIISGTSDLGKLESAAQRAGAAAENLASAQDKASKATEEYSNAADNAAQSAEASGAKGVDAITAIAETIISAKITEKVIEIANAVYELADAYSDAQEIVVNATGAAGDSLNGLEQSMMNVYAGHNQDLNTTAGAIGEINTRMALTGDELTEVTGLFLDYSRITSSDVVGSIQNVTKVMNQWGVEGECVESVLDRLAYAGQISGASVDSLSQTLITGAASFKEAGLSLDNTIKLLADFELAGISGSTAITAMRTAVNNFTNDGKDAEAELQNVITNIANMEDSTEATALAIDTFGTRAGQQLASAIKNGTVSIDSFNASLESANGTLRKTAESGETLGEKWEKSNNKIKAAFTTALQPTIDKLSSSFANVTSSLGDFLNKHPSVTKAIAAIGIGLGVAAASIAGVAFAVTVAIPAITAFGTSIQAALGPIGWISLGATVLAGGILALTSAFSGSEDQITEYNGTMEECANEISRTEAAYDRACEIYGENSASARELADNLETLNAQYEHGGGNATVYAEKAEKLASSFDEISTAQKKAAEEIDKTETSGLTAIAMLESLSEQSNLTNTDLDLMTQYANYLNDEFNCDIKVNYDTKELIGFDPQEIIDKVIKAAENERYQTAMEYLSGAEFQDNYLQAKKNVQDLSLELDVLNQELNGDWRPNTHTVTAGSETEPQPKRRKASEIQADIDSVTESLEKYKNAVETAEAEIETYGLIIDDTGSFAENFKSRLTEMSYGYGELSSAAEKQTEALQAEQEGTDAATTAAEQYTDQILELSAAYDEAYQSALESMQGQFGLFDEASTASEEYLNSTVANAQAALDSQLTYWTEYQTNLETLVEYGEGLTGEARINYESLIAYAQSGSEEAAGLAASIAASIEQGDTEAVAKLAGTLSSVDTKQREIADLTADWSTHFSEEMDDIVNKMNATVSELNLSSEANAAAVSTINSYASAIRSGAGNARSAAQSVVDAVKSVFDNANLSYSADGVSGAVKIEGHATGTTNAEDVFVAGENGPELIVGKSGSTVFPNSETNKIISALDDIDKTNYRNSYITENSFTDNSAVNNYSGSYDNYNQTESAQIFNNYTNIEKGSSYDDSAVIHYLDSFISIFSAIERDISNEETHAPETSAEISEIVNIVDLSILDDMLAKFRSDGDVSNFDESITYGDTQNIDNSRSYSTKYGDNDLSRASTEITNYGDVAQSIENSHRYGDRDYEATTSYNAETSLSTSADSVINDVSDSIVEYGDMIRSYNNVLNCGDTIKRNDSSEQTDILQLLGNSYSSDNSRKYEAVMNYGDTVKSYAEKIRGGDTNTVFGDNIERKSANKISRNYLNEINASDSRYSYNTSADYSTFTSNSNYSTEATESNVNSFHYENSSNNIIDTATNYGDSMKTFEENYNNSANSSQAFENGIISMVLPMWKIITKMIENSFIGNLGETERYYNTTQRYNADSTELVSPEVMIDSPYLSILKSESRIVAGTSEESPTRIMPPEPNDSDERDNGKDGGTRRIVIEIAGNGSIDITNGADREQVLELLQDNLKPVLMNIISNEIYEEGELSYDF